MSSNANISKLSFAGLLITLGIVYGDIGTSPLYVMGAVVSGVKISEMLAIVYLCYMDAYLDNNS
jgi:KUP system potassium uptake protein